MNIYTNKVHDPYMQMYISSITRKMDNKRDSYKGEITSDMEVVKRFWS